jgi:hypothetical protein
MTFFPFLKAVNTQFTDPVIRNVLGDFGLAVAEGLPVF